MLAAFPAEHGLEMQCAAFLGPHTSYCSKHRHAPDPPHLPKESHTLHPPHLIDTYSYSSTHHTILLSLHATVVSLVYENVIQNGIRKPSCTEDRSCLFLIDMVCYPNVEGNEDCCHDLTPLGV